MVEFVVEVVGDVLIVPGLGGSASPCQLDGSLLSAEVGSGDEAVLVVGIENDHPLPGLAGSGGTGDWGDGGLRRRGNRGLEPAWGEDQTEGSFVGSAGGMDVAWGTAGEKADQAPSSQH